jgi:hypothetical protein
MYIGYDTALERNEFFTSLGINIEKSADKAWRSEE